MEFEREVTLRVRAASSFWMACEELPLATVSQLVVLLTSPAGLPMRTIYLEPIKRPAEPAARGNSQPEQTVHIPAPKAAWPALSRPRAWQWRRR